MSNKSLANPSEVGTDVTTFFLACECKPGTPMFSVIDPFAYDIRPAFIKGTMGILHYDPESYAIVDLYQDGDPIIGYAFTVSHRDTISLIDRMKGFFGHDGYNMHIRVLGEAYSEVDGQPFECWCYLLTENVVNSYETIEQVEFGMWDENDENLEKLLSELIEINP